MPSKLYLSYAGSIFRSNFSKLNNPWSSASWLNWEFPETKAYVYSSFSCYIEITQRPVVGQ